MLKIDRATLSTGFELDDRFKLAKGESFDRWQYTLRTGELDLSWMQAATEPVRCTPQNERRGLTLVKAGDFYYLPDDTAQAHPLNAEMDESMNSASAYFYVLTYAHFAHIIGGLIALLVMSVKSLLGRYGREDHQGLWAGTIFWHFLAGLWVYLLLFLAYVH